MGSHSNQSVSWLELVRTGLNWLADLKALRIGSRSCEVEVWAMEVPAVNGMKPGVAPFGAISL